MRNLLISISLTTFCVLSFVVYRLMNPSSMHVDVPKAEQIKTIERVAGKCGLDPEGSWQKICAAFGNLGIDKFNAAWLGKAWQPENSLLLQEYDAFLSYRDMLLLAKRNNYPDEGGCRVYIGDLVWFSCTRGTTLPWTCEHLPFHASRTLRGIDRFFINPKTRVNQ